jgi:hypothetical protein
MAIEWATAVTILVPFGAAYIGQILSHRYSKKREEEKYKKECLQNLYSPIVFRIRDYIQLENHKARVKGNVISDKGNPLNPETIFAEIMDYVGKNMKYADPDLIMRYEIIKSVSNTDEDSNESGDNSFLFQLQMELCGEFLIEFIKVSKEAGTLSRSVEDNLKPPLFFTQFYLLLRDCKCWELADTSNEQFNLIEKAFSPDDKGFLEKILITRKKIYREHKRNYKDCSSREETFAEAFQFIHKVIDEIPNIYTEATERWKDELRKGLNEYNQNLDDEGIVNRIG